ncbi:hypothetical protein GcC1_210006 [Golovinomyces cichoracearum]|uniref:Uncharacterized protein n=1 Tax=Golovinomyces cichoracearum TaxID=62708 RepID=A0A420HAP4_9PEZI|nr:hypothetical protein GcC1_210006 [Golovinomyces cichoracearum]
MATSKVSSQEETLRALLDQINAQEALLNELRLLVTPVETEPCLDPVAYHRQLCCLTATYRSLTNSQPYLPIGDFVLPDLLAIRSTSQVIRETQVAINDCELSLQDVKRRLEEEQADNEDAKLIQAEIKLRISSLEQEIKINNKKSPHDLERENFLELQRKKNRYDNETTDLMLAFNSFIEQHLAPMLAVEELGGPIVGQIIDIHDEILQGEFNSQGKAKKVKLQESKRQRRISQIWSTQPPNEEKYDEKCAAAAEMKSLIKELLNKMSDESINFPDAYIKLHRESAAARYLVRSKIAQFHPKDASRLRLIDFGNEIDD